MLFSELLLLTKISKIIFLKWNKIQYKYYRKNLNLKNLNRNEKCCLATTKTEKKNIKVKNKYSKNQKLIKCQKKITNFSKPKLKLKCK